MTWSSEARCALATVGGNSLLLPILVVVGNTVALLGGPGRDRRQLEQICILFSFPRSAVNAQGWPTTAPCVNNRRQYQATHGHWLIFILGGEERQPCFGERCGAKSHDSQPRAVVYK